MSETPGLRDRKKQRTRREIEEAALDLFDERGFEGTTIDDVAAAADIAPRTFFHYFPSKEDVVLADYTIRLDQIVAALKASPADQAPWPALRDAFLTVGADYEVEREELLRRFRIIQTTPSVAARNLLVQASWEEAVADAVSDWLGLDDMEDIRPWLIAGAALAAMRTSLRRWLTDDGHSRLPDHITYCFDVLEGGLGDVSRPT
ncbi:MAG: TetR family transcriptional regulator [Actinomycetota bacterium]|nr:TetR family transcriptional regulator [Actinomycetota bacterium]